MIRLEQGGRPAAALVFAALALAACGGDGGGGSGPEPVASVTVAPSDVTLPVGESQQLTATARDAAGAALAGRTITWESSDDGVATVTPTGLVSAVGPGAATVAATSEGKSGNAALTVFVPVATVVVSPDEMTLIAGAPRTLQATPQDAGGHPLSGRSIAWATSDPQIATVSPTGVVTGLAPGAVTITATSEGKEGSAAITVGPSVTFASVATGGAHTCALTADGAAYCWGHGGNGQLGVPIPPIACIAEGGPSSCIMVPVPVRGGLVFAQLAAGGAHVCGLTADGTAWCWGRNESGQLGDNSNLQRDEPVLVATDLKFASIDAGAAHTCALTSGGAAHCWGFNDRGQLGDGTTIRRPAPVPVTGGHLFEQIAAGGFSRGHTCGVSGATLYCWGDNGRGQLGNGSGGFGQPDLTPHPEPAPVLGGLAVTAVTAGLGSHTCALTESGDSWCWGENTFGALGNGGGPDSPEPELVSGGLTFAHLIAGGFIGHTCGWTAGGTGYCWGENERGQVGDGSTLDRFEPSPVTDGHLWGALDAGFRHTCGITLAGVVYCWGSNGSGQIGNNTNVMQPRPRKVLGQP
ncbi:MAG: Ig-like domain-containing protein [Gemmatimonadales bacterium]